MTPLLTTGRLILRPFSPEDGGALHEYLSLEEVVRFEPYGPLSPAECAKEAERRAGNPDFIAVCLKSGELIGNLYLAPGDFGAWELGYAFNPRFGGRGCATEAARAAVDRAVRELSARRIIARCDPRNAPSWRLLERLGMRREGHLRENIFFKRDAGGEPIWLDTYEYAILAGEWLAKHPRAQYGQGVGGRG